MRPLPLMADRLRLSELPFDPRDLGFETVEFDHILDEQPPAGRADPADLIEPPDPESIPTTATTDVWVCDQHELICGNALVEERTYQTLMADDQAEIVTERKQAIVEELESEGLSLDLLVEELGKDLDPFDLICHIAFDKKPLTRRERAENVKKREDRHRNLCGQSGRSW
jgi:EcoEI R protein C-terminal